MKNSEKWTMEISKELQKRNKNDLIVSYDLNSLYPSAQIDIDSTWPEIETAYPFNKHMSNAVCRILIAEDGMF